MYDYDALRKVGYVGYAHSYLQECWNKSELKNKADVTIYKQLLEIDAKLGTTQSEQLFKCVFFFTSDGFNPGLNLFLSF